MSECKRGRDGGEQNQASAATIAHASAGDTEGGIPTTTGTCADAESLAADRIAEA